MIPDALSRAQLEHILSENADHTATSFCQATTEAIEIGGQRLIPDETKGYIEAKFSHGFPVVNAYGQALHPQVVSISYPSLLHQPVNLEHTVVAYNPEKNSQDKFIGTVVAVDFPKTPYQGWKVPLDQAESPAIHWAASFAKLARGMDKIVGKHLSGRHQYAVSMEVQYPYRDCAFAVALNGTKPKHDTPDDMVAAGWEYIPWLEAPDDLLECYSPKRSRIVSEWNGRRVVQLMGGLDKPVHYSGAGVVEYGAEKPAEILQMAASNTEEVVKRVLGPLADLANLSQK